MALLDKVKPGIDFPRWQMLAPFAVHTAGAGICTDKRNDDSHMPYIWQLLSAAALYRYDNCNGGFGQVVNPGLSSFGAGSVVEFAPTGGPRGSIGSGCTTQKIVTTTALAVSLGINQLVYDRVGLRVRIIGKVSGKVEERKIVGNTAGSTPTLYLDSALTFTPAVGDSYEILSGRVMCLGNGATGATQFRAFNLALNAMTSLAGTGLTLATDSSMVVLDETYVPYDRKPGEGFLVGAGTYDASGRVKNCLVATAIASGTITGQASAGDAAVLANEFRNFQIRIVEDTATPTAVGQRRIIASHTAGPSAVYTLGSAWAVTPSPTAKFVIENPNLLLLFTVAAGTAVYTYNYTPDAINNGTTNLAANTWSSTYFAARSTVVAAGTIAIPSWSHEPRTLADGSRLTRQSWVFSFRGGGTTLDILDIAGGVSGSWSNTFSYASVAGATFSTGSGGDIAASDQEGVYAYLISNVTTQVYRFNIRTLTIEMWTNTPAQSGTAAVGCRIAVYPWIDRENMTDKMSLIFVQSHLSAFAFRAEVIS